MHTSLITWIIFNFFILGMLALDLGVFHRKAHVVHPKEAALWSSVWVSISILFGIGLYFTHGSAASLEFFTAYVIEESLSVDNLFVIALIFKMHHIRREHQHRVLFWGILGAIVMRAVMIIIGVKLIEQSHWVIYVFGIFLIYAGISSLTNHLPGEEAPENHAIRWLRKHLPVTKELHGQQFFVIENGKWFVTPLFIALLFIEFADLMFALDSIPAVLGISRDPFIVYSSNIFAILGLRSMYFLLAHIIPKFYYIHHALAFILGFVGTKMLLSDIYPIPVGIALAVIAITLITAILASIIKNKKITLQK